MATGICKNEPDACSLAKARKRIPMPTRDSVCPECGFPLDPTSGNRLNARLFWFVQNIAPAALAVVVVVLLIWRFGLPHHNQDDDEQAAKVRGRYILSVSGSPPMGSLFTPVLVTAWLSKQGATSIALQPLTQHAGSKNPESVIQANLHGSLVLVDLKLNGDDVGFASLAASKTDLVEASRSILPAELAAGDLDGNVSEFIFGHGRTGKLDVGPGGILALAGNNKIPVEVRVYTSTLPRNPAVTQFIDFALSAAGQRVITLSGFDPVRYNCISKDKVCNEQWASAVLLASASVRHSSARASKKNTQEGSNVSLASRAQCVRVITDPRQNRC
jgi:hypothetical protein